MSSMIPCHSKRDFPGSKLRRHCRWSHFDQKNVPNNIWSYLDIPFLFSSPIFCLKIFNQPWFMIFSGIYVKNTIRIAKKFTRQRRHIQVAACSGMGSVTCILLEEPLDWRRAEEGRCRKGVATCFQSYDMVIQGLYQEASCVCSIYVCVYCTYVNTVAIIYLYIYL